MTTTAPATFAAAQDVLAAKLPGYARRPQQEMLALAVEKTFSGTEPRQLLAQAGTGTGKSLAAAIPAILSGKRIIIATSTIALMTQYATKDLPFLEANLGTPVKWAQLKGIGNFLCLSKLEEAPEVEHLKELREEIEGEDGKATTHTGDKDDVVTPITPAEWSKVSSSSDECPGKSKCAFGEVCFGQKHRAEAMEASVVITNTAMLMTDLKLKREIRDTSENGEGKSVVVGPYDGLIVDEAHELESVATDHLGFDIKQGGLMKYADLAVSFLNLQGGAEAGAEELHEKITRKLDALGIVLAKHLDKEDRATVDVEFVSEHFDLFESLYQEVARLDAQVGKVKIERGAKASQADQKQRLTAMGANFLRHIREVIQAEDHEVVRWVERYTGKTNGGGAFTRWVIKTAPIDVGPILHEELWSEVPAVLMSATLATGTGNAKFAYIANRLGVVDAETLDVGSPFDYPSQALLFHPAANVPAPGGRTREEWETWAPEATMELVRAAKGGAMLLYTSRSAMNRAHRLLAPRLEASGYTCLLQGAGMTNKEIATSFRADEDSVLFGLRSFMTGMDFSGKTCRLVVIDKLPFPVPTEPIFEARAKAVERRGGSSFADLSVPIMTLILEQAFGRLIRSVNDWGVVAILDSRLASKGYGRGIVRALPDAAAFTDLDSVRTFFDAWNNAPVTLAG